MLNKFLLLLIFIYLSVSALGQSKQLVKINITSYQDISILLASYYGDKIRLVDTAYSTSGKFEFSKKKPYPAGIYMIVASNKSKLFEFIINGESIISLSTDTSSYIKNIKVRGSEENEVFFDYVKFNENIFKKSKVLSSKLQDINKYEPQYDRLINSLDSLNELAINYKLEIIETNPQLFVSKLMNSMSENEIPDTIRNNYDSLYSYIYYKEHYWDNLDLADDRFLRTPMLDKKINDYFDRLIAFQPDSVIKGIDFVLSKSESSEEIFSYLIWKFIGKYQNPKYMGFDKVFVHIVELYFQNSDYKIENASESIINTLTERAAKIKPLLLGSQAPNLILIDTAGQYTSFNHLKNEYIAIVFWDYECGICKKEIKFINDNIRNWKYNIGIFAVNVNGDLDKWKAYIKDHNLNWTNVNGTRSVTADFHDIYDIYGTPVIYLLDKKRNIVAKRIAAEKIISIIENLENN